MAGIEYQVKAGDSLSRIAVEYGTSVDSIMRMNSQIVSADDIYAGQVIVIPNDGNANAKGDSLALKAVQQKTTQMGGGTIDEPIQHCPIDSGVIKLYYFYDNGAPVEGVTYLVNTKGDGKTHSGDLSAGKAVISPVVPGGYSVEYQARDEIQLKQLRETLKLNLDALLEEVRKEAQATQDGSEVLGYFEGIYQGAKLFFGTVVDLVELIVAIVAYLHRIRGYIITGDLEALRGEFEQLFENVGVALDNIQEAFDTLAIIIDDAPTRDLLVLFIGDYFDALSGVQKAEMAGRLTVEILLIILTLGAAAAVSAAAKSGKLVKVAQTVKALTIEIELVSKNKQRNGSVGRDEVDYAAKPPNSELNPKTKDQQDSQSKSSYTAMQLHKVACFKAKDKDHGEYEKQLSGQEQGLNEMTVQEYLNNRDKYDQIKRKGTGKAQKQARLDHEKISYLRYEEELMDEGYMGQELADRAMEKTKREMETLHALHNPDLIAGGYDVIQGLGDAGINQSIGAQWNFRGDDDISRIRKIDEQAKQALKDFGPDAKMNIKLSRCK